MGKSSVSANLAAALAAQGLKVGLVDADIYGFSIPRMLGVDTPVQGIDDMIIPPVAHGVKVISIGMFIPDNFPGDLARAYAASCSGAVLLGRLLGRSRRAAA